MEVPPVRMVTKSIGIYVVCILCTKINRKRHSKSEAILYDKSKPPYLSYIILRYISEPDKGLYDAMNKGIRMATGEVVGILNSDDFYTSSDVVEKLEKELATNRVDAVYGDIHFVDGNDLGKCVRYYSSRLLSGSLIYRNRPL